MEYLQLEQIANQTFAEIQLQLYANAIPWNKLSSNPEKKIEIDLSSKKIQTGSFLAKKIQRKAFLWTAKEKISKQEKIPYRLIQVNIELSCNNSGKKMIKKYSYQVLAKKT